MASLTRNQWIAIVVPIVAALISGAALLLADSGGTENNCRDTAQCAGGDANRTDGSDER
ncbi:hypothetical protein SCA03_29420 [Streptomyces cacaoi]|uniref:Uncharacterized protein n=1 Tax=Streptomyces cacaoi TaxID=1898 RepID=A0A4Y3QYQ8_STRCI|nr:hypothetical protein SCA03_29420 [Streptomyces cacaoi]